ncbi:MAG: DUF475 domain-containing protein [Acuticoccus sp.]
MKQSLHYFRWSFAVTAAGLVASFVLGWFYSGTLSGAASFLFVGTVLAVLEISLSFDNAIVNANKLKTMDPVWQRRFLTWGILIAVFGMRIVFPLAVVSIAAGVGPVTAVLLAATEPQTYAHIMHDAHEPVVAFGGTFLLMVALGFFLDREKEIDWIEPLERRMRRLSHYGWAPAALTLAAIVLMAVILGTEGRWTFITASLAGLFTYVAVDLLSSVLDRWSKVQSRGAAQGGLGAFLYLEMLDASFSFDGVIGAFALTQNLFLIAIGLGIGAMYVRSMTLMIVERGTLASFRYLEHGAFWSILALSVAMYLQVFIDVPEIITGFVGAVLIGVALASSIRFNRAVGIEGE